MRFLALAPLLLAAACAASSNDVASAESAVAGQNICDTLDYGPRPAPNDAYFFFADTAAATTYMQKAKAAGLLDFAAGPDATFAEIEAPDSRIGRMVAEAFAGYKLVFPRETAGLDTPPPAALITTTWMNAFVFAAGAAAAPGDEKKLPWIFVVQSALVNAANDDQLRAIVAHELGHLILRNGLPEVRQFVRASYRIGPAGEDGILAESQANDPAIDDRVSDLTNFDQRLGPYYMLGYDPSSEGLYSMKLLRHDSLAATRDCQAAVPAANAFHAAARPFVYAGNVSPTPAEAATLAALSDAYLDKLKICFAESPDTRTIAEQFMSVFNITPDRIDKVLYDEERAVDADPTLTTLPLRLLHAEEALRAKAIAYRNDPTMPLSSLRYYDKEEDADDDAIRVLRAIGKTDGAADAELIYLSPAARAQCLTDIAAGTKPIDYGSISEPHHTDCWRAYHKRQLMKALDACPTTDAAKRSLRPPTTIVPPLLPPPPVID